MPIEIVVAIIGLLGSAAGSFAGIAINSKLTSYRLAELEKKVNTHNKLIDRTYKLEELHAVMQEQIKIVNHRIEDLEEKE